MEKLEPEAIRSGSVKSLSGDIHAPEDILRTGGRRNRGPDGRPAGRLRQGELVPAEMLVQHHDAECGAHSLSLRMCRYGHVGRTEMSAMQSPANKKLSKVSERATPAFVDALRRTAIAAEAGLVMNGRPRAGLKLTGPARTRTPVSRIAGRRSAPRRRPFQLLAHLQPARLGGLELSGDPRAASAKFDSLASS